MVSYSPEDSRLKDLLVRHLKLLERFEEFELRTVDRVHPGDDWRQEMGRALDSADVALLLISADYLGSDVLQDIEVPKLFRRRAEDGLKVIPVLLRTCSWEMVPWLESLALLPQGGQAIASYDGDAQEAALTEVVKEIARIGAEARELPATPHESRAYGRLLTGIHELEWAPRIRVFLDSYVKDPGFFCGRESDVAKIGAWVDDVGAAPNLLVTAPAGRGKSALLVQLAMALGARVDVDVVFIPVSLRFDTHRPEVFLGCLVARLHAMHGRPTPDLRRTSVDALEWMVHEYLDRPLPGGRTAVVILDGLDEAVDWSISPRLLQPRHPLSNRLIVSARERPDDPGGEKWLRQLGWTRLRTAQHFRLPILGEADVAAVIERQTEPARRRWARDPQVIGTLTRRCKGEPLTLWLLLDLLDSLEDPAQLDSGKPGLASAFEQWLEEQRKQWKSDAPQCEPDVRALLHLLAVAEGGLTRADILALAGDVIPDGLMLDLALRHLCRLIHGAGNTSGYVLAHPGFAQHLRETLDLGSWCSRIVKYTCKRADDLVAGRMAPVEVPRYVVLHHATHLGALRAPLASWMGLCTRAWYDAWQAHEPGASGFLHDVERAWDAVAQAAGGGADDLANEARCALVRGSVASLVGNIHADLLEQILEHGIRTPEQAFAYVRSAPVGNDPSTGRGALLKVLAPRASRELLPLLFDVACDLLDAGFPGTAQDLLPSMAAEAPREAVVRLRKIAPAWLRAVLLLALAKDMDTPHRDELLPEIEELAHSLTDPAGRAQALLELALLLDEPKRARAMLEAFTATRQIPEAQAWVRGTLFAKLASEVPAASAEALDAAARLGDHEREFMLEDLIAKLPPPERVIAIERFRAETTAAREPGVLTRRWRFLLDRVPEERSENLGEALDAVSLVADPLERARALVTLLSGDARGEQNWRHDAAARALEIIGTIDEPRLRLDLLTQLCDLLPPGDIWRSAQGVWPAVENALRSPEAHRFRNIVRAPLCDAPVATALAHAQHIAMPVLRAETLADVAQRLSPDEREPVVEEALAAARAMETPRLRALTVFRLLFIVAPARQREVLEALDDAIASIRDPYWYVVTLLDLARRLGEAVPEVIDVAAEAVREHGASHLRFDHFCNLVELTSGARREALFAEALAEAKGEARHPPWSMCLSMLTKLASPERRRALLQEGLASTERIDDAINCIETAASYAGELSVEETLDLADWIDESPQTTRARAYLVLLESAPDLRERLFERALAVVRETEPEFLTEPTRFVLLGHLGHLAPPEARPALLREALDSAREALAAVEPRTSTALIEDPYYADNHGHLLEAHISSALRWMAESLPEEWIVDALDIADTITSSLVRVQAAAPLIHRLGEAERTRWAEAVLARALLVEGDSDPREQRRMLIGIVGGFLPLQRRLALEDELPGQPGELPVLWIDLPDEELLKRLDRWLSPHRHAHNMPHAVAQVTTRLPLPRRQALVSWLLERIHTLKPSDAIQLLVRLLPILPEPWVDHYLDMAKDHGIGDHAALAASSRWLDARQLDRALSLLEADRSRGYPRDSRLEALGIVSAEWLSRRDPPRERLRRLLHETLRARSETRADALLALAALRPLIVGLGGRAAAAGVVRAIRDVGASWA